MEAADSPAPEVEDFQAAVVRILLLDVLVPKASTNSLSLNTNFFVPFYIKNSYSLAFFVQKTVSLRAAVLEIIKFKCLDEN